MRYFLLLIAFILFSFANVSMAFAAPKVVLQMTNGKKKVLLLGDLHGKGEGDQGQSKVFTDQMTKILNNAISQKNPTTFLWEISDSLVVKNRQSKRKIPYIAKFPIELDKLLQEKESLTNFIHSRHVDSYRSSSLEVLSLVFHMVKAKEKLNVSGIERYREIFQYFKGHYYPLKFYFEELKIKLRHFSEDNKRHLLEKDGEVFEKLLLDCQKRIDSFINLLERTQSNKIGDAEFVEKAEEQIDFLIFFLPNFEVVKEILFSYDQDFIVYFGLYHITTDPKITQKLSITKAPTIPQLLMLFGFHEMKTTF